MRPFYHFLIQNNKSLERHAFSCHKQGNVFSNVLPKMTTVDVICYKYKPLKTGELPLKIKVCKDRKTRYINLGVSTKAEYWDFEKNQPKSTCPDRELLEKLISSKISEVKSKIVELKSEDKEFSATTLVDKVSNPVRLVTVGELLNSICHVLKRKRELVTGSPYSKLIIP